MIEYAYTLGDILSPILVNFSIALLIVAIPTLVMLIFAIPSFGVFLRRRIMGKQVFLIHSHSVSMLLLALPVSILGMVAGYLTSLSREAAVTALVPAALSLVGGFAVYLIGKERSHVLPVFSAMVVFAFFVLFGTLLGSDHRHDIEGEKNREEVREKLRLEVLQTSKRKALEASGLLD